MVVMIAQLEKYKRFPREPTQPNTIHAHRATMLGGADLGRNKGNSLGPAMLCLREIYGMPVKRSLTSRQLHRLGSPYYRDMVGHYSCVNAVSFSRDGTLMASGGDDTRVLLWNVFSRPGFGSFRAFVGHTSNIFCTVFDRSSRFVLSCGNDATIQLYDLEYPITNPQTRSNGSVETFVHHAGAVYRLSWSPTDDNLVLSASDDGFVLAWDLRTKKPQGGFYQRVKGFNSVEFEPLDGRLFITGHCASGLQLWDIRKVGSNVSRPDSSTTTLPLLRYNTLGKHNVSSATFSSDGSCIVASVRKSYPLVYKTEQTIPWLACAAAGYQNSCTLKNICFGGPDGNYVLSGSDDFSVLMWKLPKQDELDELPSPDYRSLRVIPLRETARSNKISSPGVDIDSMFSIDDCCLAELSSRGIPVIDTPQVRLVGHRSIVNNVVWHPTEPIMAACGVEKYIRRAQKLSSDLTLTVEPAFDLIPIYIYIIPTVWSPFRMGGPEDSWVPQRQRKAGSIDRGIDPFGVNDEIEQRSTQESTETLSLFDLLLHIDKVRGNRTSSDGESEQRIDSNSSEAHSPEHSSNADEVDQVGVARRLGSRWLQFIVSGDMDSDEPFVDSNDNVEYAFMEQSGESSSDDTAER